MNFIEQVKEMKFKLYNQAFYYKRIDEEIVIFEEFNSNCNVMKRYDLIDLAAEKLPTFIAFLIAKQDPYQIDKANNDSLLVLDKMLFSFLDNTESKIYKMENKEALTVTLKDAPNIPKFLFDKEALFASIGENIYVFSKYEEDIVKLKDLISKEELMYLLDVLENEGVVINEFISPYFDESELSNLKMEIKDNIYEMREVKDPILIDGTIDFIKPHKCMDITFFIENKKEALFEIRFSLENEEIQHRLNNKQSFFDIEDYDMLDMLIFYLGNKLTNKIKLFKEMNL